MSDPFLGCITIFGFNFPPRGWAQCDGQILPIAQNQSLFSLLGTTYGGDGRTSFALPDMRGRAPMHTGSAGGASRTLGQKLGDERVSLSDSQIPPHSHTANASSVDATANTPQGNLPAPTVVAQALYGGAANLTPGAAGQVSGGTNGTAHNNMQPFNTLNFCIALVGLFPSRN